MSLVVFTGQERPEKNLEQIMHYKVYLSTEQKEEILNEIIRDSKIELDEYQMDVSVEVTLKKYKNGTKNIGI